MPLLRKKGEKPKMSRFLDAICDFWMKILYYFRFSDLISRFHEFSMEFLDHFGFFDLISRFHEFSMEFLGNSHYFASRIFRPPRIALQIAHFMKFELFLQ